MVQQSIRAKVKPDNHFKLVQKTVDDMFDKIESRIDAFYKFITQYFPNSLNRKFHTILKTLNTKLKDARKVFNDSDWLSKLLALGTQMFNAYLCGIINGFIDAINGVFQLIGLVCYAIAALNKGASDILFAASMLVEVFENIFEAIIEFDLIGFLWKCVKLPFKFVVGIYKFLKQITETDLKKLLKKLDTSLVKIAYVCGNIVGFIIQLLLEALCTGGVAAVEDLIQTLFKFLRNPAESIANGIKATINISKEFFYNLIYKLSKFFESLKSKAAYKAIDEWVEQLLAAIKKELGISDEVMNGAALVKRGNYLGQVLKEIDLIKLEKFLSKLKVELQIGPSKGAFKVEGFFYESGNALILKPKNAAMFVTDGIKMKLVLRENATIYETLRELMHFRHCQSLGIKEYYNLKQLADCNLIRERYVYEKMIEHMKFLNQKELEHAKDYLNVVIKEHGYGANEFVELPFDINKIPKKRQPVNIDKILNLK